MAGEKIRFNVNGSDVDVRHSIDRMFSNLMVYEAHRAYAGGVYRRIAHVSDSNEFSFVKPIMGYGEGWTAEAALVRTLHSLDTWIADGTNPVDAPGTKEGPITPDIDPVKTRFNPGAVSQFDAMFDDDTELWLTDQYGPITAACRSDAIDNYREPVSAEADDPLDAIAALAQQYHFRRRSPAKIRRLPVTLFHDLT